MIERAVAAGIPFGWVTADEAYGNNGPLRAFLVILSGSSMDRRKDSSFSGSAAVGGFDVAVTWPPGTDEQSGKV
jgi:hypothetical protein